MYFLRQKSQLHPFPPPSSYTLFSYWLFHFWIIGETFMESCRVHMFLCEFCLRKGSCASWGSTLQNSMMRVMVNHPFPPPFSYSLFSYRLFHFWITGETFMESCRIPMYLCEFCLRVVSGWCFNLQNSMMKVRVNHPFPPPFLVYYLFLLVVPLLNNWGNIHGKL